MSDPTPAPAPPHPAGEIADAILGIEQLAGTGKLSEALAAIDAMQIRHPSAGAVLDDLRGRLLEAHDATAAEAAYRRAVAGDAGCYWAHYHLGDLLLRLHRSQEAAAALCECVRLDPQEPRALFKLCEARAALGDWEEAHRLLDHLSPGVILRPDLSRLMDEIEAGRNRSRCATMLLDSSDPRLLAEAGTWHARAARALEAEDWTLARQLASRAIEIAPDVAHPHVVLGRALEKLGLHSAALAALESANHLDHGRNPEIPFHLGRLQWMAGDTAAAAACYARTMQLDPTRQDAKQCLHALGPDGEPHLAAFARRNRTIRLGSFDSHLWLDGHGRNWTHSAAHRHHHHYFGAPPFNIGDQFVAQAIRRVLRIGEFYTIPTQASAADYDRLNAECEILLMRGSNFIYPGFFSRKVGLDVLRRVKIPIVCVGAGFQFKLDEEPRLLPGDVDCLKYIHDSCASSSVRGPRCAELLASHGIHNVCLTGCPTILWTRKRTTSVRPPSLERAAWTITDFNSEPAGDLAQLRHLRRLHAAAKRFHPIAQGGELSFQSWTAARSHLCECSRVDRSLSPSLIASQLDESPEQQSLGHFAHDCRHWPAPLLDAAQKDGFFAHHIHEYLRFLQEMTFVAGTRLHGNMMALVQGIPTAFCVHDARVQDMVELMCVPSFRIDQDVDFTTHSWDWNPWIARHAELHDRFISFFEANGLPHQLEQS